MPRTRLALAALPFALGACHRDADCGLCASAGRDAGASEADAGGETGGAADTGDAADALVVAVIGDFGEAGPDEAAVAELVASWEPDLVLTVGDNNYFVGGADTIDANIGQYYSAFISPYTGDYGPGADENRFFPTLGNHDWMTDDAAPYLDYFELPGNERYYELARGPARFFALDSDSREPDGNTEDSTQGAWFAEAAAAATEPWRIAYFHHAPWSSATHGDNPEMQWDWAGAGVQLVLAGHDHDYERVVNGGVLYLVDGAGGARLYPLEDATEGSQAGQGDLHGAVRLDIADDELRARFVTAEGDVFDEVRLLAGQPLDAGAFAEGGATLVPEDATWSWWGADYSPPDDWTTPDYADADAWPSGPAPLGYGNGDEATEVDAGGDDPERRRVTTDFRTTFEVEDPAAFEALLLRVQRDDGAIAWINGHEVWRSNLPGPEAEVDLDTPATLTVWDWFETAWVDTMVSPDVLVAGANVLAVEVHQASPESSDLRLAATLLAR